MGGGKKRSGVSRERARMPRDSTTLTFVIVGDETPIYECEIKAGARVSVLFVEAEPTRKPRAEARRLLACLWRSRESAH